jgi:predicted DsbA family dithiol-disulfide isomerase
MRIELFADVVCPWCLLGSRRLDRALAAFGQRDDTEVEVVHRSFQLDPSAPVSGGESTTEMLMRKYGSGRADIEASQEQLTRLGAAEGLALRLADTVHTNTSDAHRLLQLALAESGPRAQRSLADALMSTYFEDGEDLGDHAVLRREAVAVGLDPERVEEVLGGKEFARELLEDRDRAQDLGISGVPYFLVDGRYAVSGAQPVETLVTLLERAHEAASVR